MVAPWLHEAFSVAWPRRSSEPSITSSCTSVAECSISMAAASETTLSLSARGVQLAGQQCQRRTEALAAAAQQHVDGAGQRHEDLAGRLHLGIDQLQIIGDQFERFGMAAQGLHLLKDVTSPGSIVFVLTIMSIMSV